MQLIKRVTLVRFRWVSRWVVILLMPWLTVPLHAYSVLTHEALVDALWVIKIRPLLAARFPKATPEELKEAHGYAYGGAIIQDLGYYPHGSEQFSDLTHYVRTGDFIEALIAESQTLDEYAFALGALSHYVSDLDGHRYATNVAEPMLYPKLRRKFGDVITYEQDPAAHLKTEFGFDVLEVAKGNFAPQAYHDYIGFYVAKGSLQRAFRDTYGLNLADVFNDFDRAIGSYRRAVSKTIPKATRVAWAEKKKDIQQSNPGITQKRFVYTMSRSSYERYWGKDYDRPTAGDRMLGVFLKLVPPIGPLRALHFKMPTAQVETLFMSSFDRSSTQYKQKLQESQQNALSLPDENYDVGAITPPGAYRLEDDVRAYWLDKLAKTNFSGLTPEIQANLLTYYSNLDVPFDTKKNPKKWDKVLAELKQLKSAQPATEPAIAAAATEQRVR
ncbi:MAG: zinc dependent phospholipase C family protein [Acidobacteriaceae bacterium]|nr:zinc dependent phospholipase C family protein [Acidobacteriaceae bacterium]